MLTQQAQKYLQTAKNHNQPREEIINELVKAGWAEKELQAAQQL